MSSVSSHVELVVNDVDEEDEVGAGVDVGVCIVADEVDDVLLVPAPFWIVVSVDVSLLVVNDVERVVDELELVADDVELAVEELVCGIVEVEVEDLLVTLLLLVDVELETVAELVRPVLEIDLVVVLLLLDLVVKVCDVVGVLLLDVVVSVCQVLPDVVVDQVDVEVKLWVLVVELEIVPEVLVLRVEDRL